MNHLLNEEQFPAGFLPAWFEARRRHALEQAEQLPEPSRHMESWRFGAPGNESLEHVEAAPPAAPETLAPIIRERASMPRPPHCLRQRAPRFHPGRTAGRAFRNGYGRLCAAMPGHRPEIPGNRDGNARFRKTVGIDYGSPAQRSGYYGGQGNLSPSGNTPLHFRR